MQPYSQNKVFGNNLPNLFVFIIFDSISYIYYFKESKTIHLPIYFCWENEKLKSIFK